VQNQQTLASMTQDQVAAYQAEEIMAKSVALSIVDTLSTLEKFCRSMPLDWMLAPSNDFSAAFIHLMREPTENIHLVAVDCLEQLCVRGKLSYEKWLQWIQEFPSAIQQVNQQLNLEQQVLQVQAMARGGGNSGGGASLAPDPLTAQLEFHRALSRMLASVVSGHLGHLTQNKRILDETTADSKNFSNFLRLLVDMLHHPSGRIAVEQLQLWISLFRDPQITNKKHRILRPVVPELVSCFMDQMVRIRWDDVEDETHPFSSLMEASWDDEDEYYAWLQDYRSKATLFFKHVASCEPETVARVLSTRLQTLIANHGSGEPRDYLHPSNQQLTMKSGAVRSLESVVQPMECILGGLPLWALTKPPHETPGTRSQIRAQTLAALSQMAQAIVSWNPSYLWLKLRRAQLLDGLRFFWKHDPSTLLQGIDSLLGYIRVADEWGENVIEHDGTKRISSETVGLRKRSSSALVSVAKCVPHHLVPWLSQLSEATREVLSSIDLLPSSRMHLYEFLSCVATAVDDPAQRATFVENVLSDAINTLLSPEMQEAMASVEGFLSATGITMAGQNPASVTDPATVTATSERFSRLYSSFNQLLSVGRRCHEAVQKRPSGGIPLHIVPPGQLNSSDENYNYPDEGPISIRDLSFDDPFVPLWPRILPSVIQMTDVMMKIWHPEYQAMLLQNRVQRYVLAISDDEAYLTKKNDGKSGGVFGEGGTAGSIISGTDRRDLNLAPRWSSWFNELRNTLYQLLGLFATQRVMFAPEVASMIPQLVAMLINPENLRSMEHRHLNQLLKQFIELLMLACPKTLYMTHLAPVIGPVFEHLQFRLDKTWQPVLEQSSGQSSSSLRPLFTADCEGAANQARQGGEAWIIAYYARSGLFVGDLDAVTGEAAVEKQRVEITRTFGDVLQAALALKGDWALVLAHVARDETNSKKSDSATSVTTSNKGLSNGMTDGKGNTDGAPRTKTQEALDARKLARISAMCHFLFLEHEQIAGYLTLTVIQCLNYPDAYTCRRITRICHRVLETTAWHPRYTEILGQRMMSAAVQNIVMEPKWMVGVEWDMINVVRDIYGRLTLGQVIQPGGQGTGQQQNVASYSPLTYEQAKTADRPLLGGGILTTPSDIPRQVLLSLPGIDMAMIQQLEEDMKRKKSAKDQKDFIRDLLRVAADEWSESHPTTGAFTGALDRAVGGDSLLHREKADVEDIPEKLVTQSMISRKNNKSSNDEPQGLGAFELF
jgi:Exportin-5 family